MSIAYGGEDFRQQINRDWQMQRVREAVQAYRFAVRRVENDLEDERYWAVRYARELRPPCPVCKNWPCTCR